MDRRQSRIVQNKAGRDVTGVKWSWPQVTEAFKDPQLYFCLVNAFLSSVPNGYVTLETVRKAKTDRLPEASPPSARLS